MANKYWIDPTGLLGFDANAGWSTTSGGLPNTVSPVTGDNVFFDNLSPGTPTSGPSAPLTVANLSVTDFAFSLPSIANLTVTATVAMDDTSTAFTGSYGASATATFGGSSVNDATNTLLSGVFSDMAENASTVTTGTFGGSSTNTGTVTNGTFNGDSLNDGTVTNGTFNGSSFNEASGTVVTGVFNAGTTNEGSVTTMTINGNAANTGTSGTLTFTASSGSNATGTVTELLTVPGTQSGGILTMNFPVADLGTFGNLALSGARSGTPAVIRI